MPESSGARPSGKGRGYQTWNGTLCFQTVSKEEQFLVRTTIDSSHGSSVCLFSNNQQIQSGILDLENRSRWHTYTRPFIFFCYMSQTAELSNNT